MCCQPKAKAKTATQSRRPIATATTATMKATTKATTVAVSQSKVSTV